MLKLHNMHNYFIVLLLFVITLKTSISYVVTIFIVLLWLWSGSFKEKFKIMTSDKLSLTFLTLFALNVVGLLWTQDFDNGLKLVSKHKLYLFAPLVISFFDKRYAKYALQAFLAAMFISEVTSLYIYSSQTIEQVGSLPSPFMHHMHYSLILAFTFGYLVSEIDFKNLLQSKNFLYLLFALLTVIVLFINKGRIGQMALLPVLLLLGIGKFKLSLVKSMVSVMVVSVVLFITAYHFSSQFKTRFDKASYEFSEVVGTDKRDSISCRFEMWEYATKLGSENPAVGIGTGDSVRDMTLLLGADGFHKLFRECGLGLDYVFNPHNNFILYFMLFGIFGVLVLVGVLLAQFKIAVDEKSLPMVILLVVTLMGMMTASPISLHIKYIFFYTMLLTMLYMDSLAKRS